MPPGSLCILSDPSPKVSVLPFPKSTEAQERQGLAQNKAQHPQNQGQQEIQASDAAGEGPKAKGLGRKGAFGSHQES